MKKHSCLLLILVITCCGAARAQIESKTAPRARIETGATAQLQSPDQHPPHNSDPRQSRWSFDLSGGAAFPAGPFAGTDEQNPKSGPVHTGSIVELSGTYHLNPHWGIALLAGRQHHNSAIDEFIGTNPLVPDGIIPGPLNPGNGQPYPTTPPQHWSMTRILAGGVYTLPLNQKKNVALLVRALAGIQKTHVSYYEYFLEEQNSIAFSGFPARNLAWAFAYQADAGLQWKVYRRWSLLLTFAGYSGCRPSYKQDLSSLFRYSGFTVPNPDDLSRKIHFPTCSILVRAGVGYDL